MDDKDDFEDTSFAAKRFFRGIIKKVQASVSKVVKTIGGKSQESIQAVAQTYKKSSVAVTTKLKSLDPDLVKLGKASAENFGLHQADELLFNPKTVLGREALDVLLQLLRDRGYLRGDIPLRYKRQLPTLANKTTGDDNKSIIYHVQLQKGFEEVMAFYIDGHIYLLSTDGVVLGTPLGVVRCDPRVIRVRLTVDRMMTFEIPIKGWGVEVGAPREMQLEVVLGDIL